jgi:hypothetical protein
MKKPSKEVTKESSFDPLSRDEPTKMQMFVAEVQKTGISEAVGVVHSVTVRVPSIPFATIEALARAGGMTRNKVIVNLLESAIQEMWSELSPEMHEIVAGLQASIIRDLSDSEVSKKGEI